MKEKTMNTLAAKIDVVDRTYYSSHLLNVGAYIELLLHWMAVFAKAALEYAFGMHVGAAVGYTTGLHIGKLYVKYFKPAYPYGFDEIRQWLELPYIFAIYGLIFGVIAGSIVIAVINSKLLRQRVAALCEQGVTDPEDMAQILIKPKWDVQMAIKKLLKEQYRQSEK
jgi:hypothetical protein